MLSTGAMYAQLTHRSVLLVPALLLTFVAALGCTREANNTPVTADTADIATAAPSNTDAPILVNLTSGRDKLHAVSMGLRLAELALEKKHPVLIFLNVDAPVFATMDLPKDVRFADFPPVGDMLRGLIDHGAKVVVCGHCASVLKLDKTSMIPGAVIADHAELLDHIEPGTVGFSY